VSHGHKVLAPSIDFKGEFWEATVQERVGAAWVRVEYTMPGESGDSAVVPSSELLPFQNWAQGQVLQLELEEEDWRQIQIHFIHPLG